MRNVVYGTVALLLVIAGLNLLTTLGLAVRERERDTVLASVGATPRQVRQDGDRGRRRARAAGGTQSGQLGADQHARDRRDRSADGPDVWTLRRGDGIRSRSSARCCWPPRSARSPRGRRRASARRPRCASVEPPGPLPSGECRSSRCSPWRGRRRARGGGQRGCRLGLADHLPGLRRAVGATPVATNVSNTVGLVFGGISGAFGYRRELRGQKQRVIEPRAAPRSARSRAASCCSSCRAPCSTPWSRS